MITFDFTIKLYKELLEALLNEGFYFTKVGEYYPNLVMLMNAEKFVLSRQDVDRLPGNSLTFARIQKEMGIRSTFYFRSVPPSFNPGIIEKIAGMGHEIGYHYEDLSLAAQRQTEVSGQIAVESLKTKIDTEHGIRNTELLFEAAIDSFSRNLEELRKYANVKTICMHGSPLSRWDSRLIWKYYDYRDFGIGCEPYFDLSFEDMLYLTDTGRRWNGSAVSVRDKAEVLYKDKRQKVKDKSTTTTIGNLENSTNKDFFDDCKVKPVPGSLINMTKQAWKFQAMYNFRSTNDIISIAKRGKLPPRLMMNCHPHRWNEPGIQWWKELLGQNFKNGVKYFIIKLYHRN